MSTYLIFLGTRRLTKKKNKAPGPNSRPSAVCWPQPARCPPGDPSWCGPHLVEGWYTLWYTDMKTVEIQYLWVKQL